MKKIFLLAVGFFTFCIAYGSVINISEPIPYKISYEGFSSVVVDLNTSAIDSIEIFVDENNTKLIPIDAKKSHICESIALHYGDNNVTIVGYKGIDVVEIQKVPLYYTSTVRREYKYPPLAYTKNLFHNETREKKCASCHDMSINEQDGVAFENIQDSNCYTCHKTVTSRKHGHAPAVNWLCTACHNGKVGMYNKRDANSTKFTVPDPIGPVCFRCHEKQKEIWDTKRFYHEPVESGRCNKCHNSHSSKEEFFLRKDSWDLCVGCHKDKTDGAHIVKTFSGRIHPTKGKKDPSQPGKMLSCVSCHNPHKSNAPSLLQSKSVMSLCARCHMK